MKITVACHTDSSSWNAYINDFQSHDTYYKANITGRGSSIDLLCGSTYEYNWIAIPVHGVATTLASFTDVFWNREKLTPLVGEVDAMTIACALSHLSIK